MLIGEKFNMFGFTTAENIRVLLEFWPTLEAEFEDVMTEAARHASVNSKDESFGFSWDHLYELPFKEHISLTIVSLLVDEVFFSIFKDIINPLFKRDY